MKHSICKAILWLLALVGGFGIGSVQAKGPVAVKSAKKAECHAYYITDSAGNQIFVPKYTEMTRQSNPVMYDKLQCYLEKANSLNKKIFKICIVPGNDRWAILDDFMNDVNFLVCPCDKTDLNNDDEKIIKHLLNIEKLSFLITINNPAEIFLVDKSLFVDDSLPVLVVEDEQAKKQLLNAKLDAWLRSVTSKYPQISFDNVKLLVTDKVTGWAVANAYTDHGFIVLVPLKNVLKGLGEVDEGALLHEMGHIDNYKKSLKYPCSTFLAHRLVNKLHLVRVCAASLLAAQACTAQTKSKMLLNSIAALSCLGHILYTRVIEHIDESKADDFACKHSDKPALLGLRKLFVDNDDMKQLEDFLLFGRFDLLDLEREFFFRYYPDSKLNFCKKVFLYLGVGLLKGYRILFDGHPLTKSRIAKIDKALLARS